MKKKLSITLPPIHLCCGNDDLRPSMMHVEIKDGVATATNAYVIARMNLSEFSSLDKTTISALNGKLIHRRIWEQIMKMRFIEVVADVVKWTDKNGIKGSFDISYADKQKFPNYEEVFEQARGKKVDGKRHIKLQPRWFALAEKLFGSTTACYVQFREGHAMFVIFPESKAKGFIGIMPCLPTNHEGDNPQFNFEV